MLETLRNAGKSWVAKLLLVLLAASFAVWGVQDVFRGATTGALAVVGDQEVSQQQYTTSLREQLQSISRATGQSLTQEDAKKLGYDRMVFDNLIQRAAIDSQADKLGLAVSTTAVEASTLANPNFHGPGGQFDPAIFANVLQSSGMNQAMYVATESQEMKRQAIVGSVVTNFTLPDTMIEALSKFRSEVRDAKYFTIRATAADVAAPTDAELKEQYDKTPAAYTAPEYRSVAVLKVEPADLAAKTQVTDDEIKARYEASKAQYAVAERRTFLQIPFKDEAEALAALQKLAAGQDFVALAQERGMKESDYQLVDKTQGELLDKQVAAAVFALPQGQVSDVVKGGLVTALLKVTSITPGKQQTLDEVKDQVRQQLQLEKAREQMQEIFDNVENARNNQTKLEDIAKEQGLPYQLVPAVSAAGLDKDGKEVALPDKPDLLKAAFASDVGDVTSPLNPTDSYIWYDVMEVIPSALKPLDQVKAQVASDVTARKVRDLLAERGKKIVEQLKSGTSIETAAQATTAEVKQAQGLRRTEATAEFDIASLSALFALPPDGFGWVLEGDGTSAKIMQSQAVLSAPFDRNSVEAKEIRQSTAVSATTSLAAGYLGALRQSMPVRINEALWQQTAGTAP